MKERNYKISVACAICYQNKILMIHERQKGALFIDIPAGGVEMGEILEEAVIREVKEECNLNIQNPQLVGIFQYIEKEKTTVNFLYRIELEDKRTLSQVKDEDVESAEWIDALKIKQMLATKTEVFEHALAVERLKYILKGTYDLSNVICVVA